MPNSPKRMGSSLWIPASLFAGFLALRLPFRAQSLINWDAVNFALGTQLFSLEHHQPHPPGYIGYVALGWLLNLFTGDANTSLTLVSIVSGALAPIGFFLLALRFMPRRYALVTAVLFGLSPLVWYYSEVALTYSIGLALALFFLWSGYEARVRVSMSYLVAATVLLVLLGAMRPSAALFLMPLWLYMAWAFPWRRRLSAGAILVVGNLAWLVPLLWLSGGIVPYFRAFSELANLVVVPTSALEMRPLGIGQNVGYVFLGILVGANLGLLVVVAGLFLRGKVFTMFARHRAFFLLWLVPALMTFLLLHTGQLGYVLLILPAVFLFVGCALSAMAVRRPATTGRGLQRGRYVPAFIAMVLALTNAGAFLFAPQAVEAIAQSTEEAGNRLLGPALIGDAEQKNIRLVADVQESRVPSWARQFNIDRNDAHWNDLIGLVESFDPESIAVLTIPHLTGSFRHLTYYVPDYQVYAIGRDLNNSFGHLFTAHNGTSDYSVEGMEAAQKTLRLPSDVQLLVIPDRNIYQRIQGGTLYSLELKSGEQVVVARAPKGTTLTFEDAQKEDAKIVLERKPRGEQEDGPTVVPVSSTSNEPRIVRVGSYTLTLLRAISTTGTRRSFQQSTAVNATECVGPEAPGEAPCGWQPTDNRFIVKVEGEHPEKRMRSSNTKWKHTPRQRRQ